MSVAETAPTRSGATPGSRPGARPDRAIAAARSCARRPDRMGRRAGRTAGDAPGNPRSSMRRTLVTPGLVDCHTHLVYGGQRADEFARGSRRELRGDRARRRRHPLDGARHARGDEDQLFASAAPRLQALLADGVTRSRSSRAMGSTSTASEDAAGGARARAELPSRCAPLCSAPTRCRPSTRGAPTNTSTWSATDAAGGGRGRAGRCGRCVLRAHRVLAGADRARVRGRAALGLPVKLHAEQLSNMGGAALAARYRRTVLRPPRVSSTRQARRDGAAGTVAVLLPGAYYMLRETQLPPIEALRAAGVPIAVATDCNPGTLADEPLLLMLNMACTLFRLTVPEALAGVTRHAARALGPAAHPWRLDTGSRPTSCSGRSSGGRTRLWFGSSPCRPWCARAASPRGWRHDTHLVRARRAAAERMGEERAARGDASGPA